MDLAFSVLDEDGNGIIEPKDVMDKYDASRHPDVISGKEFFITLTLAYINHTFARTHTLRQENTN